MSSAESFTQHAQSESYGNWILDDFTIFSDMPQMKRSLHAYAKYTDKCALLQHCSRAWYTVDGDCINLIDFLPSFMWETKFVTSCLLSCIISPFWERIYSKMGANSSLLGYRSLFSRGLRHKNLDKSYSYNVVSFYWDIYLLWKKNKKTVFFHSRNLIENEKKTTTTLFYE